MRIQMWIFLMCILLIAACLNEPSSKPTQDYSPEDAEQNGDVVVLHKAESFDEIASGNLEIMNEDKVKEFLRDTENGEEASVTISILERNGEYFQNELSFDGKMYTFENNYHRYKQSPKGTYTCEYVSPRGSMVYLETCKSDAGKDMSTILAFIGKENY